MNICYILRGLPGTGKSMLAENLRQSAFKSLISHQGFAKIFSTDDLFMVDGEYEFDPSKLGVNHARNLQLATDWMIGHRINERGSKNRDAICIIDNTNTQHWEYEKYVEAAKENGFMVHIISVDWKQEDIPLYAERNTHGVPEEAIQRMADRWEY